MDGAGVGVILSFIAGWILTKRSCNPNGDELSANRLHDPGGGSAPYCRGPTVQREREEGCLMSGLDREPALRPGGAESGTEGEKRAAEERVPSFGHSGAPTQ